MKILLFATLATTLPILLALAAEQVLDTNGDPVLGSGENVFSGSEYYVLPAIPDSSQGGGLTLDRSGGSWCIGTVIQEYLEANVGLPVRFIIKDEDVGTSAIFAGTTTFDIEFLHSFKCDFSTRWAGVSESNFRSFYVALGQYHSSKYVLKNGYFKIERYGGSRRGTYKLVFCSSSYSKCHDIGRTDHKYGRRLVSNVSDTNDPYQLVFVNARSQPPNASHKYYKIEK